MQWSDVSLQPAPRLLRQFAALWIALFMALAAMNVFWRVEPRRAVAFTVIAMAVGLPGLARPLAIRWIYVGWMIVAFPIGWTVSQLVMTVLFYGLFTPISFVFRLAGRDALERRSRHGMQSYWVKRAMSEDLRSYFRQS